MSYFAVVVVAGAGVAAADVAAAGVAVHVDIGSDQLRCGYFSFSAWQLLSWQYSDP